MEFAERSSHVGHAASSASSRSVTSAHPRRGGDLLRSTSWTSTPSRCPGRRTGRPTAARRELDAPGRRARSRRGSCRRASGRQRPPAVPRRRIRATARRRPRREPEPAAGGDDPVEQDVDRLVQPTRVERSARGELDECDTVFSSSGGRPRSSGELGTVDPTSAASAPTRGRSEGPSAADTTGRRVRGGPAPREPCASTTDRARRGERRARRRTPPVPRRPARTVRSSSRSSSPSRVPPPVDADAGDDGFDTDVAGRGPVDPSHHTHHRDVLYRPAPASGSRAGSSSRTTRSTLLRACSFRSSGSRSNRSVQDTHPWASSRISVVTTGTAAVPVVTVGARHPARGRRDRDGSRRCPGRRGTSGPSPPPARATRSRAPAESDRPISQPRTPLSKMIAITDTETNLTQRFDNRFQELAARRPEGASVSATAR